MAKPLACPTPALSPIPTGAELGPQQKRIVELEAQAAALHAHVASLEEELGSRGAAAAGATAGASEAAARAEAAEARAKALEAEAENLGKQVALLQVREDQQGAGAQGWEDLQPAVCGSIAAANSRLQSTATAPLLPPASAPLDLFPEQERLGRGEYNAATTRVLHFKYNPEAELAREARDARLAELESENEALRQNLGRLEAAAAQVGGPARHGALRFSRKQRSAIVCKGTVAASAGQVGSTPPPESGAACKLASTISTLSGRACRARQPRRQRAACGSRSWRGRPTCCAAGWQSCRRASTGCSRSGCWPGWAAAGSAADAGCAHAEHHVWAEHASSPASMPPGCASQVFNKQITLFREAVYILFGFRVEMATDPAARWGQRTARRDGRGLWLGASPQSVQQDRAGPIAHVASLPCCKLLGTTMRLPRHSSRHTPPAGSSRRSLCCVRSMPRMARRSWCSECCGTTAWCWCPQTSGGADGGVCPRALRQAALQKGRRWGLLRSNGHCSPLLVGSSADPQRRPLHPPYETNMGLHALAAPAGPAARGCSARWRPSSTASAPFPPSPPTSPWTTSRSRRSADRCARAARVPAELAATCEIRNWQLLRSRARPGLLRSRCSWPAGAGSSVRGWQRHCFPHLPEQVVAKDLPNRFDVPPTQPPTQVSGGEVAQPAAHYEREQILETEAARVQQCCNSPWRAQRAAEGVLADERQDGGVAAVLQLGQQELQGRWAEGARQEGWAKPRD